MLWWKLRQLKSKDREKRRNAIYDLGYLGDTRAIEALIQTLNESDPYILEAAIESLRRLNKIGDPRTVKSLLQVLKCRTDNYYSRIHSSILSALSEMDLATIKPLEELLQHENSKIRKGAVALLNKMNWQPANTDERILQAIASLEFENAIKEGETAANYLVGALKDKDENVKSMAAKTLEKMGKVSIKPLITILKDKDERVRKTAANILELLDWQPSDSAQLALFTVAHQDWKKAASLGQAAVNPLINVFGGHDQSLSIRLGSYSALEQIPNSNVPYNHIKNLIETVATEIRVLNSRTQTLSKEEEYTVSEPDLASPWSGPLPNSWTETRTVWTEFPAPDITGIRELIAKIPESLRKQVYELCGNAKIYFNYDQNI